MSILLVLRALKTLKVGCFLLAILLCSFALLNQPVRAQTVTAAITGFSYPSGVAVTPNGRFVYVTNIGSSSVSVISTATNTVTANVSVGSQPGDVAITPNGEYAYVTDYGSDSISVINTATNKVTSTIPLGSGPNGLAITPNG